jgi:hypothetical protein
LWMVLRENLIFYGITGGLALLFIIIMLAYDRLTLSSIPSLCIALGNGYGLLLLCVVLGYGFIQLPKTIWQDADPANKYKRRVNQLFKEVRKCANAVADADATLNHWDIARNNMNDDMAGKYVKLGNPRSRKLNLLKSSLPIPEKYYDAECTNKKITKIEKIDWKNCSESDIEDFFCLMDKTAEALDQCKNFVMSTAHEAEVALSAYRSSSKHQKTTSIKKTAKRAFCVFLIAIISLCYWGEISLIFKKPQISIFYQISRVPMSPVVGQMFITFPIITFILFVGGWALVNVRIGSHYRFIPHASNANTLNYWAILLCRLGPTIGYHYMLQIDATKTSFVKVMGIIDKVIFIGESWNYISPILMIIVSIFVGFDLWDKLKAFCSCCLADFDEDFSTSIEKGLQTGEEILRELSFNVNNWIEENPSFSVINISAMNDQKHLDKLEPLNP